MADNPYPHMRHERTAISDAIDSVEMGAIAGTARAGLWVAKKAAKGVLTAGKYGGKIGLSAASVLGTGTMKAANYAGRATLASLNSNNPVKNPVSTLLKATSKIGSAMVDYKPAERVYNKTKGKVIRKAPRMKLSKFGMGVVLAGSVLSGAVATLGQFQKDRLGTIDSKAVTTTPDSSPQEYGKHMVTPPDIGGATGDLVFALFKNRRGGSLL